MRRRSRANLAVRWTGGSRCSPFGRWPPPSSVFGGSLRMSRPFLSWLTAITYDVFGSHDRRAAIYFNELISAAQSLPTLVELESRGKS